MHTALCYAAKLRVCFIYRFVFRSLDLMNADLFMFVTVESARLLKDVPRTILSLPGGHRGVGMPKITLQQRVRALFGLG